MKIRCWWHIWAGILTVWSVLASPALPIVCALGFLCYEKQQDKNTGGQSCMDIYEWTVAVYINVAVILILKGIGVL